MQGLCSVGVFLNVLTIPCRFSSLCSVLSSSFMLAISSNLVLLMIIVCLLVDIDYHLFTGWYKAFGQVCAPCSSRCKKCIYKYDFCTHCNDDGVWYDYKCFQDCGKGKFHDSSRRCLPCDESCVNCSGTAPNECTECEPGMTLNNGMCLPGCLVGFYNSSIKLKCVPCMKDCLKCEGKLFTA